MRRAFVLEVNRLTPGFVSAEMRESDHLPRGTHIGGGGAQVIAPPSPHAAISRRRVPAAPPVAAFGTHWFRFRPRPIHPLPPVLPVYGYPFFFGGPFFGFGVGWGFNSCSI